MPHYANGAAALMLFYGQALPAFVNISLVADNKKPGHVQDTNRAQSIV